MTREILVVSKKKLFLDEGMFEGFLPLSLGKNILPRILSSYEYKERTDALEHNPSFKQVVSYVWFVNPKSKKAYFYRRTTTDRYKEVRLRNKWSGGVGGHIDKDTDANVKNPIHAAMVREVHEEVDMKHYPEPEIVGFVYDDMGDVEKHHMGIVAIAETTEEIGLGDGEIAEGRFMSIEEIDGLFDNPEVSIERYSQLSWPFVREYLRNLN